MDFFANDISSTPSPPPDLPNTQYTTLSALTAERISIFPPHEVVYQDVRHPEILDDVRVDVDLAPGPVCAVVENHPVLWPPHVVTQPQADLLQD